MKVVQRKKKKLEALCISMVCDWGRWKKKSFTKSQWFSHIYSSSLLLPFMAWMLACLLASVSVLSNSAHFRYHLSRTIYKKFLFLNIYSIWNANIHFCVQIRHHIRNASSIFIISSSMIQCKFNVFIRSKHSDKYIYYTFYCLQTNKKHWMFSFCFGIWFNFKYMYIYG